MRRGGSRPGSGRPRDTGLFGEKTTPIRIPLSQLECVNNFVENGCYRIPLYASRVAAGSPSFATDEIERIIDINELVIRHPTKSFLLQAEGDSMINAGIYDGDFLLVDQSAPLSNGKIVVAIVDGEATVKRFKKDRSGLIALMPENDNYQPIYLRKGQTLHISGVVSSVIRNL